MVAAVLPNLITELDAAVKTGSPERGDRKNRVRPLSAPVRQLAKIPQPRGCAGVVVEPPQM